MAQVPIYNQNEVGVSHTPTEYQKSSADASSFGVSGLDKVGEGLSEISKALISQQIAQDKEKKEIRNTTALLSANTTDSQFEQENLKNLYSKKGMNAIGQGEVILKGLDSQVKKQAETFTDPLAKNKYLQSALTKRDGLATKVAAYEREQEEVNRVETFNTSINTKKNDAILNRNNPADIAKNEQDIANIIKVDGIILGQTPEVVQERINKEITASRVAVLSATINDDPQKALQQLQDPNVIKSINDPEKVDILKKAAISRFKAQSEENTVMGLSNFIRDHVSIAKNAMEGKYSFGELHEILTTGVGKELTTNQKNELYKMAGINISTDNFKLTPEGDIKVDTLKDVREDKFNDFVKKYGIEGQKIANGEYSLPEIKAFIQKHKNELQPDIIEEAYKRGGHPASVESLKLDLNGNIKLPTLKLPDKWKASNTSLPDVSKILKKKPYISEDGAIVITNQDKTIAYQNLVNNGAKLSSGELFKGTAVTGWLKEISKYQHSLNVSYNAGLLTQGEYNRLSSSYTEPLNQAISERFKASQGKNLIWGKNNNYGYDQIKDYVSKFNDDDKKNNDLSSNFQALLNTNYYVELTKQAQKKGYKSMYDLDQLDDNEEKEIYKNSFNTALSRTKATSNNPYLWFSAEHPALSHGVNSIVGKEGGKRVQNNVGTFIMNLPTINIEDIHKETSRQVQNEIIRQHQTKQPSKSQATTVGNYKVRIK